MTMQRFRKRFGKDVALLHDLNLDYAAGDRVVIIPNYPMGNGRKMAYWSVNWHDKSGRYVYARSGVAATPKAAEKAVRDAIAAEK
jgi:hypothetical protein